ncbi:MAG: YbgC/FadM family acyl-CoA thioesterase [Acetobacter sp.]|jgi:acyl-CoA thioester hydrolase|nr:YbgC/FadM family acyl-CoA thioesterase [Acetobacter sp.]
MTSHTSSFRIYYEDTDAGGVVYHARYFAFAERARTEAIRSLGMTAAGMASEFGCIFVVRSAQVEYLRPLHLDELVSVTTTMKELRPASCRLMQIFEHEGERCATIDVRLACVRLHDHRAAPFPPLWRDLLSRLS